MIFSDTVCGWHTTLVTDSSGLFYDNATPSLVLFRLIETEHKPRACFVHLRPPVSLPCGHFNFSIFCRNSNTDFNNFVIACQYTDARYSYGSSLCLYVCQILLHVLCRNGCKRHQNCHNLSAAALIKYEVGKTCVFDKCHHLENGTS